MGSKNRSSLCTLIGDIVGSRAVTDQKTLLVTLRDELDWVNLQVQPRIPLRPSVGDELQGAYDSLSDALWATLLIILRLRGTLEVRFGMGWGEVDLSAVAVAPVGQTGEGWWLAREAIDTARKQVRARGWPASSRSRFLSRHPPTDAWVNAFLICRDQVLARFDSKDARITLGAYLGEPQEKIAAELGIRQSTVSSRARNRGASALLQAHRSLEGLPQLEIPDG